MSQEIGRQRFDGLGIAPLGDEDHSASAAKIMWLCRERAKSRRSPALSPH